MSGVVEVLSREEDHVVAAFRNLVMVVWRRSVTLPAVQRVHEVVMERSRREPTGKVALLMVLEAQVPPPSDEARRALGEGMTRMHNRISGTATVDEGRGWRALTTAHRMETPFSSVAEAAEWLAARIGTARPLQILDAVGALNLPERMRHPPADAYFSSLEVA